MKKIIYFGYYIFKSDYTSMYRSIKCLKNKYNPLYLFLESILCSIKYGTSFDDYFSFRFYEKTKEEKASFATTSFMYEFHKKMNNPQFIQKIDNKVEFRKYFREFSYFSEVFSIDEVGIRECKKWIEEKNLEKLVIKAPEGSTGKGIYFVDYNSRGSYFILDNKKYEFNELLKKLSYKDKIYVEPRLNQHSDIQNLAPSALNTIRIITVLDKHRNVNIISAAFRISLSGNTDNFSTGNLAASVDVNTGKIITPGIKRRAACSEQYIYHPITQERIVGFQIPHWQKVIEKVKKAGLVIPQVRTVGWDVAVLKNDVIIIEGNPSWNKGAPQIPNNKGIKLLLMKYLEE